MMARQSISKGKRFDVFRRDGFTCRYCGAQPPDVVLEVDHVLAVSRGGTNDPDNLVTACHECNGGKAAKTLSASPPIDADQKWLEAQQEIAELRRYQQAKAERDELLDEIIADLQETWVKWSRRSWYIKDYTLRSMLASYSPDEVEHAVIVTGAKVASKQVSGCDQEWLRYMYGVLRNAARENGNGS